MLASTFMTLECGSCEGIDFVGLRERLYDMIYTGRASAVEIYSVRLFVLRVASRIFVGWDLYSCGRCL